LVIAFKGGFDMFDLLFNCREAVELAEINKRQIDLTSKINNLVDDTNKNSRDIEFLQKFMFERMNPTEQITALENGMFSGMTEAERARQITKIELVKQKQDLINSVGDFGQGAASVARIAERLHVDPNVVSSIQQSAQIASAAQTAISGILSGGMGYLAAADVVSGLVFGKGPDAGTQRHAEIMSALGEIKQGIAEIEGMLVQMGKQLDDIKRLQITTYQAIVTVSKQIEENHKELMHELSRTRDDLVPIQSIVNEILFKKIEACGTLKVRLEAQGWSRDKAIEYSMFRSTFREHGNDCLSGLKDIIRDPFSASTYDLRHWKGDPDSQTDNFIKNVSKPMRTFQEQWVLATNPSVYAKAYGMPVTDIRALRHKRDSLFGSNPPVYDTFLSDKPTPTILELLGVSLSPQTIDRHVRYLIFAHPFFEMREALEYADPKQLLSLGMTSIEGRELLLSALALVEVAVAQQNMLAGDVALLDMTRIWREGTKPREPNESDPVFAKRTRAWEDLKKLLAANGTLERNLILTMVSEAIRATGRTFSGNALIYGMAYNMDGDPSYLRALLAESEFRLVWRKPAEGKKPLPDFVHPDQSTGWHVQVDDLVLPLPTPTELSEGRFRRLASQPC
jgi:hypothetical protein